MSSVKSWSIILAAAFMLFLSSAIPGPVRELAIGKEAPSFELSDGEHTVSLGEMKGKYVLINFWSSAEAQSRINNKKYAEAAERLDTDLFAYISVCTDTDSYIAEQILELDGVKRNGQFISVADDRLLNDYRAGEFLTGYLINPQGELIVVNPDAESLKSYIGTHA